MEFEFPTTAGAIGKHFDATILGDENAPVLSLSSLEDAKDGSLSFLARGEFKHLLYKCRGAVLLTTPDLVVSDQPHTYLLVDDPQFAFSKVAKQFFNFDHFSGVSSSAAIDPTAILSDGVNIGHFAVISKEVKIGKSTNIFPYAYLGRGVEIGEDCNIYPRVTLLDGVKIGNRVTIFPGSVIGSPGFGFFKNKGDGKLTEMPQVGGVLIEDDVRIGALVTIDRGAIGTTKIGQGTIIDDQVHIAHNCQIGRNCILCGGTAVGGSSTLEDGVILAGQVGVSDHVRIGKGARVGAQAGISTNLVGNETYIWTPAIPQREGIQMYKYMRKLPKMWKRMMELEKRLEQLK